MHKNMQFPTLIFEIFFRWQDDSGYSQIILYHVTVGTKKNVYSSLIHSIILYKSTLGAEFFLNFFETFRTASSTHHRFSIHVSNHRRVKIREKNLRNFHLNSVFRTSNFKYMHMKRPNRFTEFRDENIK